MMEMRRDSIRNSGNKRWPDWEGKAFHVETSWGGEKKKK